MSVGSMNYIYASVVDAASMTHDEGDVHGHRPRIQSGDGGGRMSEKLYRCVKEFYVPLCDDDGLEDESGEMMPVEVGEMFYRSDVTWMNDVRLEGCGKPFYGWVEISNEKFAEHFEEVDA